MIVIFCIKLIQLNLIFIVKYLNTNIIFLFMKIFRYINILNKQKNILINLTILLLKNNFKINMLKIPLKF